MLEFIFVVKRKDIESILPKSGFLKLNYEVLNPILAKGFFIERNHSEQDPDFKQIIPYIVFYKNNNKTFLPKEVFCFQRLKGGKEKRLHNLYSIGIGGHINPEQKSYSTPLELVKIAAQREIYEETTYEKTPNLEFWGLINNDKDEVGQVHTGIVFGCEINNDENVEIKEKDILEGQFLPFESILKLPKTHYVESWTSMLIEGFNVLFQ